MVKNISQKRVLAVAIGAAALGLAAGQAGAAGFALIENSGSGMGNAFAGGAAAAEDASTIWFNPAGMSMVKGMQAAGAVHLVTPMTEFQNGNSQPALGQPLGGTGGDAGGTQPVPNLFFKMSITPTIDFGLGINAPFGLTTEYDDNWLGRFQGVKSEVKTINVNPALSFKVTPELAVGVGVSYQRIDATLTSKVNYTAVVAGALPPAAVPPLLNPANPANILGLEGLSTVDGDDSAWGWNIGALWQATPDLRVGAHYRSKVKYTVEGTVDFNTPTSANPVANQIIAGASAPGGPLSNGSVHADIELPDMFSLSAFMRVNPKWDVMGDVTWTGWSSIPKLEFVRSSGAILNTVEYDWQNTWRVSVGANYRHDSQWMFRGGIAWDQSPIDEDRFRTPRLPDGDRTWLALGAQYKLNPKMWIDVGGTYIFVKEPKISNRNEGNPALYGTIDGTYDSSVWILSGQFTYQF